MGHHPFSSMFIYLLAGLPLNHPFSWDFPFINHPFLGGNIYGKNEMNFHIWKPNETHIEPQPSSSRAAVWMVFRGNLCAAKAVAAAGAGADWGSAMAVEGVVPRR